jgi:hypothetical protein
VDSVRRMEDKTPKAAGTTAWRGRACLRLAAKSAAMEPKDSKEFAEVRISELKTARAC